MDDLIAELMPIYLGELHEHVKLIAQELLAFEAEKNQENRLVLMESMFRTVHSLKGASRAVALNTAASVCHEMENIFSAVQAGAELNSQDYHLMLKATDALDVMGQLLQIGDDNAERRLAPVLFVLRETGTRLLAAVDLITAAPATARTMPFPEALSTPVLQKLPVTSPEEPPPQCAAPTGGMRTAAEMSLGGLAGSKAPAPWAKSLENSVRLPIAKLDNLLAEGSDLITVANRNSACLKSVTQMHTKVMRWQREKKFGRKDNLSLAAGLDESSDMQRLITLTKELEQLKNALTNEDRHLTTAVSQVTSGINGLRMVPIGQACQGIDRVVRDVAVASNKKIELFFGGMDIEVDRNVLEQLRDPIMHLVRNACDHGIETLEERLKHGKRPEATLKIQATVIGSQAQIMISDDGRGISNESIRARARKLSMPVPEDESAVKNLIFAKGFSTSPIITEVSGRGIGLDIVKDKVEGLHGSVDFQTVQQGGTTFTLTVPLTLTSMRVLFVRAGGQLFAVSTASIQKVIRLGPDDFQSMEGRSVTPVDGVMVPVTPLAHILDMPSGHRQGYRTPAMVLFSSNVKAVLIVEELFTEQEILVKNLGVRIKKVKHIGGSTILPDGQIALIINTAEVVRSALNQAHQGTPIPVAATGGKPNAPRRRLLLADDSITTRSLEKHVLESAGFEVTTCVDGAQAWQMINEKQFDLVVSDVEMPRMDGFALTRRIKSSNKHMHLPVVLVTALSSDRHKALGISSGADAYLVKSEFERSDLLEVINQLL
ncbi:MAG: hybrid sensor histidine kinase/response regulator [Cyanobacteria bacterium REEB67]|nr:hybrid sensor histidine kinase/response regulator [Cyanobacteria bacterium REEB67]